MGHAPNRRMIIFTDDTHDGLKNVSRETTSAETPLNKGLKT